MKSFTQNDTRPEYLPAHVYKRVGHRIVPPSEFEMKLVDTIGLVLSIPMFIFGIVCIVWATML